MPPANLPRAQARAECHAPLSHRAERAAIAAVLPWRALILKPLLALLAFYAIGCSTLVTPTYFPRTTTRLQGETALGSFKYLPFVRGEFEADELDDSTPGAVRLSDDVGTFVKNSTASELERAGLALRPDATTRLVSEIESFEVGSFGFSVEWRIAIRYALVSMPDRTLLFDRTFTAEKSHGKGTSEIGNIPSALVSSCIEQLLADDTFARIVSDKQERVASSKRR